MALAWHRAVRGGKKRTTTGYRPAWANRAVSPSPITELWLGVKWRMSRAAAAAIIEGAQSGKAATPRRRITDYRKRRIAPGEYFAHFPRRPRKGLV